MEVKFTVGELAKLHHMPKQNLIFYDKIGLFKPKIVDPHNQYRYYTPDQLEVLDSILMLKESGVPLKEIKIFLEERNPSTTLKLIQEKKNAIEHQIEELKRISKRLERKIEVIQTLQDVEADVEIKYLDETYIVIQPVKEPFTLLETDIALKGLLKKVTEEQYQYQHQLGVIIPKTHLLEERYVYAISAFFPLESYDKKQDVAKKEEGFYAVAYHKGTYEDIGITYKKMIKYIEEKGYNIGECAYEYCMADSLTCKSPNDYVTAIHIQLEEIADE